MLRYTLVKFYVYVIQQIYNRPYKLNYVDQSRMLIMIKMT